MKSIRNNKNFRINKYGNVELCSGIKDSTGNLIYENDWLESINGERVKIIYDNQKKKLVGVCRYGAVFSMECEMTKNTINKYYSISENSEIYDINYK